ncbi:MAG: hypothetical protein IT384_24675, partial [Deltaproteobacteria bacterium]|nr:hypothetical protein [Deltaproteobacteria bacterium]
TQVSAWDLVAEVEIRVAILEETTTRKAFDQVAGTQLRRSIGEALLELKRVVGAVPPKTSGKKGKYAIVHGPVADVAGAMAAVRLSVQCYAQRVIGLSDPRNGESVAKATETLAAIDEVKRDWKPGRGRKDATDESTAADETAIAAAPEAEAPSPAAAPRVEHAPIEIEGPRTNGTTASVNG